jgi:hypothetical protein
MFAHQNGLLYYETSAYWGRDLEGEDGGDSENRGGIATMVDQVVQEIVLEIMHN